MRFTLLQVKEVGRDGTVLCTLLTRYENPVVPVGRRHAHDHQPLPVEAEVHALRQLPLHQHDERDRHQRDRDGELENHQ